MSLPTEKISKDQEQCKDAMQKVAKSEGLKKMETKNKCIKKDLPDLGNTRHGLICLRDIPSAFPIHVLKNEPIQQASGCLSNKLDSNLHICFAPFSSDRKGFEKGTIGSWFNENNYVSMGDINMMSRVALRVCQGLILLAIPGKVYRQEEYQKGLQTLLKTPEEPSHLNITS